MNYVVDTCVWRDFFENRIGFQKRDLGHEASVFFSFIIASGHQILYSEALLWELKKDYSDDNISGCLRFLQCTGIAKQIPITQEEFEEAKIVSVKRNLPKIDCLFAIQARNNDAILISQDKHILCDLSDLAQVKRPLDVN